MAGRLKAGLRGSDMRLLAQGVLRKGQEVEVRPGIVSRDSEGRATCVPIYSRIITLLAEQNELQYAVPGGLIGVGTTVSLAACCKHELAATAGLTPTHLPETVGHDIVSKGLLMLCNTGRLTYCSSDYTS